MNRILPAACFLLISLYVFFLGRIGLPVAHDFFDRVVMRDVGTVIPFLLSQENPLASIILQTMKHVEGPLQFLVLNIYFLMIGDMFPLNPVTMQFPNTLLALATCAFAYLAGSKLLNSRFGGCCAISFVLAPWFSTVLRLPEYFKTLSCLLHFSTFYFLASLALEPKSGLYRVLAPLSLTLYMFTGLDWPSYMLFLGIFLTLTWSWRTVLRNPFNVLPVLGGLVLLVWQVLLLFKFGIVGLGGSLVGYPFARFLRDTSAISSERILENTLVAWGPQLILAIAGLVYYVWSERQVLNSNKVARGYLDAASLWLLWAGLAVLMSSGSPQYLYVVGMPAAVLSGLFLSRLRNGHLVLVIIALVAYQVGSLANWTLAAQADEKRRILAAACFLIEQRPDLLGANKKLLAVDGFSKGEGGTGGAVLQYARPYSKALVIPTEFPEKRQRTTNFAGGPPTLPKLNQFVDDYMERRVINADAIVMESSALEGSSPSNRFWQALLRDPQVDWIACFSENGGVIYIGEIVKGVGKPLTQATRMDVRTLSEKYSAQYDRLSFLKQNVQNVYLFFVSKLSGY